MKRKCSTRTLAAAVSFLWIVLANSPPIASQDATLEYEVKAAFLYNFAKFIEWPSQTFSSPDEPFTVCLAGDDPFRGALERTVQGENLNGRPLAVRRVGTGETVRGCQILYVSGQEERSSGQIVAAAANAPVLLVGEAQDFIAAGGMIRFAQTGHRIRFEINPDAAERASLKVSSRLLRLADVVRPRQREGDR